MLFESIFCGFWALNLVFVVCEMCERCNVTYNKINDELNKNDWYLLPTEMTQMFLIIMINAQKPLDVKFFGSASLGRYQFRRVS